MVNVPLAVGGRAIVGDGVAVERAVYVDGLWRGELQRGAQGGHGGDNVGAVGGGREAAAGAVLSEP